MICKKIPYASRKEAMANVNYHGECHCGVPYRCKRCGMWHFGNKTPKKSQVGKLIRYHQMRRRSVRQLFKLIDELCGVED